MNWGNIFQRLTGFGAKAQEKPSPPATKGYQPQAYIWGKQPRDLPPFTFLTIQAMLGDPTVRKCYGLRAAPMYGIEFAYRKGEQWIPGVEARNPTVAAFIQRQLKRLWSCEVEAMFSDQVWGWSAGEITYRLTDFNTVEIDELIPRHACDVRVLERDGKPCGVRFERVKQGTNGHVDLPFPRCWWHAYEPEPGRYYGVSASFGSYSPWADKWFNGCALDVRRLFMHKNAYGGDDITYPEGVTYMDDGAGGTTAVPNRDIARQLVEQLTSGGVTTRPAHYVDGNEQWKLTRAVVPSSPTHILQYPKDLDEEIYDGMGVSKDMDGGDGSGAWAGKRVTMAAFCGTLDRWAVSKIRYLTRQIFEPLVLLNFGKAEEFNVSHKPLAVQAMEQQSNAGPGQGQPQQGPQPGNEGGQQSYRPQQPANGQAPQNGNGKPQNGQSQPQVPQRMSLELAVGRGDVSAEQVVRAARAIPMSNAVRMAYSDKDRWITTDSGVHIQVDDEGRITKGPGALKGRFLKELPKKRSKESRQRAKHADIRKRFNRGENAAAIGKDHGLTERHVRQIAEQAPAKNLHRIAREIAGDSKAEQAKFKELVEEVHKRESEGPEAYNSQLTGFLKDWASDSGVQAMRGRIQLIRQRGGDANQIKGFDEWLESARMHYPAMLHVPGEPGHDEESALMENIARGTRDVPSMTDDSIINEAADLYEAERDYQPSEEGWEDDDPIPFALMSLMQRAVIAMAAKKRKADPNQKSMAWDEDEHPRDDSGKFASEGGGGKAEDEKSQPKETAKEAHSRLNLKSGDRVRDTKTGEEYTVYSGSASVSEIAVGIVVQSDTGERRALDPRRLEKVGGGDQPTTDFVLARESDKPKPKPQDFGSNKGKQSQLIDNKGLPGQLTILDDMEVGTEETGKKESPFKVEKKSPQNSDKPLATQSENSRLEESNVPQSTSKEKAMQATEKKPFRERYHPNAHTITLNGEATREYKEKLKQQGWKWTGRQWEKKLSDADAEVLRDGTPEEKTELLKRIGARKRGAETLIWYASVGESVFIDKDHPKHPSKKAVDPKPAELPAGHERLTFTRTSRDNGFQVGQRVTKKSGDVFIVTHVEKPTRFGDGLSQGRKMDDGYEHGVHARPATPEETAEYRKGKRIEELEKKQRAMAGGPDDERGRERHDAEYAAVTAELQQLRAK